MTSTTGATSGPLDFSPTLPLNLNIRVLPSTTAKDSKDLGDPRHEAPSLPPAVGTDALQAARTEVPPSGRRARPAAGSRSPSTKRRGATVVLQKAIRAAPPAVPVTLESLSAAMKEGLKHVEMTLVKAR